MVDNTVLNGCRKGESGKYIGVKHNKNFFLRLMCDKPSPHPE